MECLDCEQANYVGSLDADAHQVLDELHAIGVELYFNSVDRMFAITEPEEQHSERENDEYLRLKKRIRSDLALRKALPRLMNDHSHPYWKRGACVRP